MTLHFQHGVQVISLPKLLILGMTILIIAVLTLILVK